jgi:hypothetical protein
MIIGEKGHIALIFKFYFELVAEYQTQAGRNPVVSKLE